MTNDIEIRDKNHIFDKKEKMNLFCRENNISYPKYKIIEKNLKSSEAQSQEKYWLDFYKNMGYY